MNKKKLLITLSSLTIIIFVISLIYLIESKNINVYYDNEFKSNNILSMMMEQNAGKGDYKMVSQSTWPSEGYIFNSELSRCENGSTLTWDDDKKQVIFSGNVSDKCYVYFDIARYDQYCNNNTLACYTAKKFTGTQGDNGMYYHDSSLTNGAGDNSYRYAGANPNNFVCFGLDASTCPDDNLYRIIGVIDGKVKLIKADYANSNLLGIDGDYSTYTYSKSNYSTYKGKLTSVNTYYWNSSGSNTWSESNLNKINLNTNFINNIGATWVNKIAITTWKVGGNTMGNIVRSTPSTAYKNEIITPAESTTYDAKIGLMYVSDYMYGATPDKWALVVFSNNNSDSPKDYRTAISVNWMHMGMGDWTISRCSDFSNEFVFDVGEAWDVGLIGYVASNDSVRPVFNLTSSASYVSGTGTQSDPIRIK